MRAIWLLTGLGFGAGLAVWLEGNYTSRPQSNETTDVRPTDPGSRKVSKASNFESNPERLSRAAMASCDALQADLRAADAQIESITRELDIVYGRKPVEVPEDMDERFSQARISSIFEDAIERASLSGDVEMFSDCAEFPCIFWIVGNLTPDARKSIVRHLPAEYLDSEIMIRNEVFGPQEGDDPAAERTAFAVYPRKYLWAVGPRLERRLGESS